MSEFTTDEPKVFSQDMVFYLSFPVGNYFKTPYSLASFRVYSSQPSDAQMSGKTGEVGNAVTTWTQVADDPAVFKVTYDAIDDSNADSTSLWERYWIGVNFLWQDGGTEVYQKRSFLIWRPQCICAQMNATYEDIVSQMGFLDEIGEGEEYVSKMIAKARTRILNHLTGSADFDIRHFHDLERANTALVDKTLSLIALDYASSSADTEKWLRLHDQYKEMYEQDIQVARIGVDTNKDNVWQPGEQLQEQAPFSDIVLR